MYQSSLSAFFWTQNEQFKKKLIKRDLCNSLFNQSNFLANQLTSRNAVFKIIKNCSFFKTYHLLEGPFSSKFVRILRKLYKINFLKMFLKVRSKDIAYPLHSRTNWIFYLDFFKFF